MKAAKAKKAPGLFPPAIKRRRFERAILRRVHLPSRRELLLGLYTLAPDGTYQRPPELTDEQLERLRELARSIKANRGVVRTGKLLILVILVAALVVFALFFKNPLVERALERGLEGIFDARAEVSGLDFRPLAGALSFDRLEVADSEAPMKNLFELGWTEVSLDTRSLLKRRFVLENVEARDAAWNTDRAASGALQPAAPASEAAGKEGEPEEPEGQGEKTPGALGRTASTVLARLDVEALVAEESAALQSPGRVAAVNEEIEGLSSRWESRVDRGRQDVQAVAGQVEALRDTDIRAIRSVAEAQALAGQLRELVPAVRRLQEDLAEVNRSLETDIAGIDSARRALEGTIEGDVSYLRSRLDLSGGGLKNLASSLASRALEQLLGKLYRYGTRAIDYGRALAERKREKRKDRPLRREGKDVAFPTEELPRFLLRRMAVSVSEEGASGQPGSVTAGAIRDLTSDPDLLDRPLSFDFSREEGPRRMALAGVLDTRSRRSENLGLDLQADNLPFALSEGLESLSLGAVGGTLRLRTDFLLGRDGRMRGKGRIELPELVVRSADGADLLGTTIAETLSGLSSGSIDFRYAVDADKRLRLELVSDLDDLLARRLSEKLAALSSEYGERLRAVVDERLRDGLAENEQLYAALKDLEAAAGGNLAEAGALQRVVAAKQKELEAKLAELQKKATDTLRKEAEKKLEEVTDQLQLPKLTF